MLHLSRFVGQEYGRGVAGASLGGARQLIGSFGGVIWDVCPHWAGLLRSRRAPLTLRPSRALTQLATGDSFGATTGGGSD